MVTKSDCIEALRLVIDPEIGINIIDVGLIYRIDSSNEKIEVDFTLTSPGCPLADTILADITNTLREQTGVSEIIASLVWTPTLEYRFHE